MRINQDSFKAKANNISRKFRIHGKLSNKY